MAKKHLKEGYFWKITLITLTGMSGCLDLINSIVALIGSEPLVSASTGPTP